MSSQDDKVERAGSQDDGDTGELGAAPNATLRGQSSALRWSAVLFTIAAGLIVWPLWQPLVLAIWFAAFARPLMKRVSRVTRGRHRAAAVLTVLLLLLVLVPLGLFMASLVSVASELVSSLSKSKGAASAFETIVSGGGGGHRPGLGDLVPLTKEYGERAIGLVTSIAGATAKGLLGVFVFVLAAYAFLAEGRDVYTWVENHLPITPRNFRRYATAFTETGRGLVVGVGLTGLVQGITATVAYVALGIPRAIVLEHRTG